MENEELNEKILKIWEDPKFKPFRGEYIPLLYPEFQNKNNCILFIGCNPSLRKKDEEKIPKYDRKNINKMIEMERDFQKSNDDAYAKVFRQIKEETKEEWTHIDLFYSRETNQNKYKKNILNKFKRKKEEIEGYPINEFGKAQLGLLIGIIEAINPKVIVVVNAFASSVIKQEFEKQVGKLDEETGLYMWDKKIPIIFSGMLTGQRALDTHSRERLIWHIKRALNFYKENERKRI